MRLSLALGALVKASSSRGCVVRKASSVSQAPAQPVIAAKHPFQVDLSANKLYPWCACGYSKKQVYPSVLTSILQKMSITVFQLILLHGLCCPLHFFLLQPFCDGSHKKAAPGLSPLRFTVAEPKTVWLCGCKQSKNPPYCDGTHKEEFVQKAELHTCRESTT
uniref:CDGSH iron-sulfur domain-containing protein 3, mitochondrial isoform X1 n=1 Tax=Geotrypetes seraphini TaxID=260995 RepID=A0A6P8NCK4_GEOSA|nr:CDGSH iron-sulfur domain-containing protein 3, mitochondrial isoform X1 [Geotrypetes seraphini]